MFPTATQLRGGWWAAVGPVVVAGLIAAVVLFRPGEPAAVAQPERGAADAGADLALVPADAAGFVHIRLADLWKNDMFAGLRKTWERAGEKAIAALNRQFVPAPSSLDRATGFVLIDEQTKEPHPFGVISFSAPFDPAELAKVYLPQAKKVQAAGKPVYVDDRRGIAVMFPDNQTVLLGQPKPLLAYLGRPVAKTGPLAGALKLAATRPVVAAANIAALPIPPGTLDRVPEDVRPVLKAQLVQMAFDLGPQAKLEVRAVYKDQAAAQDAEKAVRVLTDMGRKEIAKIRKELEDKLYDPNIKAPRPPDDLPEAVGAVFALGGLGRVDDLFADPNLVTRDGTDLAFSASLPKELIAVYGSYAPIAIGLLLPAVQKVRAAAARSSSQNNLKQIGLAIHSYHDANNSFPHDITDKSGKPILSWRVAILPFIEQQPVYNGFKLDEPWDSENNKKFSKAQIKVFISPSNPNAPNLVDPNGYGLTSYKGVSGPGTAFEAGKKLNFVNFTDGLSNTVMVVEAGDPIPWAKPGDYPFDPKKPLPKLSSPGMGDLCNMLLCDGSVRTVNTKTVSEKTLKAAFTRAGGEVLGKDW